MYSINAHLEALNLLRFTVILMFSSAAPVTVWVSYEVPGNDMDHASWNGMGTDVCGKSDSQSPGQWSEHGVCILEVTGCRSGSGSDQEELSQ